MLAKGTRITTGFCLVLWKFQNFSEEENIELEVTRKGREAAFQRQRVL